MTPKILLVGALLTACFSHPKPKAKPAAPIITTYESELSQAKERLTKLSQSDPAYPEAAFALCLVYYQSAKELRTKERDLQDSLGPLTSSPISNERFEEAARCLSAHTQSYPSYPKRDEALFLSGDSFYSYQQTEKARQFFLELIKNYPSSMRIPEVYFLFGEYYFEAQDAQNAKTFYEKTASFPESPLVGVATYQSGWCAFNLGDYTEAIKRFLQALSYAKQHTELKDAKRLEQKSLQAIVVAYAQVGSPEKAPAFFEKINPGGASPLLKELYQQYKAQGKTQEALALCIDYSSKHNGEILDNGCKQ